MVHRPPLLKYSFISSLYALYSKNLDLHAIGASIISSPTISNISLGIAAYIPEDNKRIEYYLARSYGFEAIDRASLAIFQTIVSVRWVIVYFPTLKVLELFLVALKEVIGILRKS